AGVIPVVLGTDSEILDVGKTHRLFTPGQLKALWIRDRHCTFPGCHSPAHWTDAHHLWHWIDGGPTDLNNAALLCGRHHTVVHRDQLAGSIVDGHVLWDRKPGSYQQQPASNVG
ncbi:MAG: HNH endonuclease signature motif containing protein, partial [Nakamurella sp.]